MNNDLRPSTIDSKNILPRIGQIIEVKEESILPLEPIDTKEERYRKDLVNAFWKASVGF